MYRGRSITKMIIPCQGCRLCVCYNVVCLYVILFISYCMYMIVLHQQTVTLAQCSSQQHFM